MGRELHRLPRNSALRMAPPVAIDAVERTGFLFRGALGPGPQLLHHRSHRPRQVDPGRPPDRSLWRRHRASAAGSDPRHDGYRTGARHHYKEPRHDPLVRRVRRHDLPPQPDRHPRTRRLLSRGAPVVDGLRRGAHHRRRLSRGRSANGRQPLSGHGARARTPPGHQQDRPARRRRRAGPRGDRRRSGARSLRCDPHLGQRRDQYRGRSRGHRGQAPSTGG